jgi:hypothetical protein
MKAFELLKVNESLLKAMDDLSLSINDVKYIKMLREYEDMMTEGLKKTYIVQTLADKYEIAERTLYRVIDKLMQEVKIA